MKRILLAFLALGTALYASAQTDTTKTETPRPDTIRIGSMVIVRGGKGNDNRNISIGRNSRRNSNANLSTNWFIFDLGFANYVDNSSYPSAIASGFAAPGVNQDALRLRNGKSMNVNIWFFMQKLNVAKHVLNLKYGLGIELNNYRFDNEALRFAKNPTMILLDSGYLSASKNKLALDYLTVPVMLNVNLTPGRSRGFAFSAGISAGYLYSARQKVKIGGKRMKTHDDFDLNAWKLSWIGELQLGPVKFYGSYAVNNIWNKGLDVKPYTVGIRFSRW